MIEIPLTQGQVALVDDADLPLVDGHRWFSQRRRDDYHHAATHCGGKYVYMHQLILGTQPGTEIDHKNRNGLDNRRANLRACTHSENQCNRRIQSNNTSGFRGVSWYAKSCKWRAKIKRFGKQVHLGHFATKEAASAAYELAALQYHGEFGAIVSALNSEQTKLLRKVGGTGN